MVKKSYFSSLKGKLVALLAITMAVLIPMSTIASQTVRIEAALGTANVSAGDTGYAPTKSAKVDDVLEFRVYYHNMENPDSGLVADDLRVKVDLPTAPGKTQTVTSTVGGSNTNTVVSTNTVNLSIDTARLEFIPGSVKWRHNAGTNDNVNYVNTPVSDAVVTGANGVVLEDAQPCFNFEASLVFRARVVADEISIVKQVSDDNEDWTTDNTAENGETVRYRIIVKNEGNTTLNNVTVGDKMPANVAFVPNSTILYNATYPNGTKIQSDKLFNGGINIGSYDPGFGAIVAFDAVIKEDLGCGIHTLRNTGQVKSDETGLFYNITNTKVNNGVCEQVNPVYQCDALVSNLSVANIGDDFTFTTDATARDGAQVTKYVYNFGDGNSRTVNTAATQNSVNYAYADGGDYTVNVVVHFNVNGEAKTDNRCSTNVKVEVPEDPVAKCSNITVVRVGDSDTYKISVQAIASGGAEFKNFVYNFGDGSDELVTDQNMVEHEYKAEGTYKIVVRTIFNLDNEMVEDACMFELTVSDEPVCEHDPNLAADDPNCKPEGVSTLPVTGPGAMVATLFGTGVLGAAARGYVASREALRSSLTR